MGFDLFVAFSGCKVNENLVIDKILHYFCTMAKEIERKFLVVDDRFKAQARASVEIRQGYLSREPERTVRVRIKAGRGFLTVKGANRGAVRNEWEYEIPEADAAEMLALCSGPIVDKTRWLVDGPDGLTWEVDEFRSPVSGLIVAEVELPTPDFPVTLPAWIAREVTGNPRYYNSNLGK